MIDSPQTPLSGPHAELQDNRKEQGNPSEIDESRRKTIKKLGKYAAYTPPALLAIFSSQKALPWSDPPDPPL